LIVLACRACPPHGGDERRAAALRAMPSTRQPFVPLVVGSRVKVVWPGNKGTFVGTVQAVRETLEGFKKGYPKEEFEVAYDNGIRSSHMQCELSVAVLNEAGEELATDDGDENGSDHTQEVLLEAQETNGDDQSVPESGAVEVTDVKPSQPKAVKSAPAVKSSRPRAPSVEVGDRVRVTWPGGRGEHDGEVVGVYPTLTGLKKGWPAEEIEIQYDRGIRSRHMQGEHQLAVLSRAHSRRPTQMNLGRGIAADGTKERSKRFRE